MRRPIAISLAVAAVLLSVAPASRAETPNPSPLTGIHVVRGRLVDASGRTVVLRGINVVDKSGWHGKLAPPVIGAADLERIAQLGFNHVRLGLTWASVEHRRGHYDDAYLDQFVGVLDEVYRAGLLAVVDMHQDVWSDALGSDGAPAWADPQCNQLPDAMLDDLTGQWSAEYFSPSVLAAWSNFFNDGYGAADLHCTGAIQTAFVRMWRHVARRVAHHPAVIGYDILNEPWSSLPPGAFEPAQLMPMYRRVAAAIRTVDPVEPIFFEPPPYSQQGPMLFLDAPASGSVFAPHVYTEGQTAGGFSTHGRTDDLNLRKDFADANRMGVPVWVGEWGSTNDTQYIREMNDLFDRYQASAAFWMYAQRPGENNVPVRTEAAHVRIYPEAYPGSATWSYNADTKTFVMTITVRRGLHSVRIVVPERLHVGTRDPHVEFSGNRAVWTVRGPGRFKLRLRPGPFRE